jgi:hypothetical protein
VQPGGIVAVSPRNSPVNKSAKFVLVTQRQPFVRRPPVNV